MAGSDGIVALNFISRGGISRNQNVVCHRNKTSGNSIAGIVISCQRATLVTSAQLIRATRALRVRKLGA